MGYVKNILLSIPMVAAALFSYSAFSSSVGDVQVSVLPLEAFQQLNGTEWVLMDGQTDLPDGNLLRAKTGWTKVPDARARFLRMKDYGIGLDADGNKDIGTLLSDLTGLPKSSFSMTSNGEHSHTVGNAGNHTHPMSEAGEHRHGIVDVRGGAHMNNASGWEGSNGQTEPAGNHVHVINAAGDHTHTLNAAGGHSHSINAGGDGETRPKNIIVNYFIKIREPQQIDNCVNIENTSTPEAVSRRFVCLRSKLKLWQDNMLKITSGEAETLIREIVFMKKNTDGKLTPAQLEEIDRLIDKYSSIVTL